MNLSSGQPFFADRCLTFTVDASGSHAPQHNLDASMRCKSSTINRLAQSQTECVRAKQYGGNGRGLELNFKRAYTAEDNLIQPVAD